MPHIAVAFFDSTIRRHAAIVRRHAAIGGVFDFARMALQWTVTPLVGCTASLPKTVDELRIDGLITCLEHMPPQCLNTVQNLGIPIVDIGGTHRTLPFVAVHPDSIAKLAINSISNVQLAKIVFVNEGGNHNPQNDDLFRSL